MEIRERQRQRIVVHEPAARDVAEAEHQLDDLGRLQRAHYAGQDPEHTALRTRGHDARRRGHREQAPVAGSVTLVVDRQLSFEGEYRC